MEYENTLAKKRDVEFFIMKIKYDALKRYNDKILEEVENGSIWKRLRIAVVESLRN